MLTTSFPRYKQDFAGAFVYQLAREVVKRNIQVTVIAPHDAKAKGFEVWDGLKVYRFRYMFPCRYQRVAYHAGIPENLRRSWLARLQVLPFALAFMSKAAPLVSGCDIIHAHWIPTGMVGLLLRKAYDIPIVLSVHHFIQPQGLMGLINRYVIDDVDHICFNSSYTKGLALRLANPKQYSIIPPAVSLERFSLEGDRKAFRKFGITDSAPIVFFLGRLVAIKGLRYLIECVPRVLRQVDAHFVIGGSGPETKGLAEIAHRLGLSDEVKFIGQVPTEEAPALFRGADVFVLPSIVGPEGEAEALGVALLEAFASGIPCIGSKTGGIVDIIDDGVNGFLVEQKNSAQLAERIVRLLRDEKLRKEMGRRGREKVEERFTCDRAAEETMAIYERLLRERM